MGMSDKQLYLTIFGQIFIMIYGAFAFQVGQKYGNAWGVTMLNLLNSAFFILIIFIYYKTNNKNKVK